MRRDESTRPYTLAQPIHGGGFAHELVPLGLATRLISARAYGADARMSLQRLTGIAHTMSALVPIYACDSDENEFRRLTEEELLSGFFRKDGAELHFTDGRAPLRNLAAAHDAIAEVVRVLASAVDREEGARDLLRDHQP